MGKLKHWWWWVNQPYKPPVPVQRQVSPTSSTGVKFILNDAESVEDRRDKAEDEAGGSRLGAGYSLGATMAAILSWHSFHAVLWALLAGLLSWFYVIYYLIVNWSNVKLI
jgi:hypothetical protein